MFRVSLMGALSIDNEGPVLLRNKKAQALVAYLALSPGLHPRERLAALLWPDSDDEAARQSLRQCLSGLRKDLPALPLTVEHDVIGLAASISSDVDELTKALSDPTVDNLKRAMTLYAGNFLEGMNARSDLFDEWLLIERTKLRARAISAFLVLLKELIARGARDEAIALALRLLSIDPLQEEIDRTLMKLYRERGQTALAIKQFKRCEAVLRKELGIEPDQETKSLYQEMLRQRSTRNGSGDPIPPVAREAEHRRPLRQAIHTCMAQDGVRIAYAFTGEGPPLVKAANWLNHLDFDFASPVWRHWIDDFSRDRTFLRYDERGTGLSDWDVFDLSFDSFVRDLETVVDAAGLQRFPLLGISQGCAISIAYAARHPERVSHLILYGGYAKGWMHQGDSAEIARRKALSTIVLEGWGQESPVFRQVFTSLFIPDADPEQTLWFNDLQRTTASPENASRLANIFGEIDVRHILKDVKAPTLVLHARGDARVRFTEGQELAAKIPNARFVPLESRNHILLADEPAWPIFLAEVRSFLHDA